ncbi:MAG: tripartite tricarboxylate transporter TctB family protein [Atribacterota bacterium]
MKKKELRKADFITSVLLLLFSVWIIMETLKMPMKDTFGGVQNVWYVSPALFPLIISIFIMILGIVLLIHSISSGGAKNFLNNFSIRYRGISEKNIRFIGILLALFSFVYLNIPRVDFFISVTLFLTFFISVFYFDDKDLLKKLTLFYFTGSIIFIILFVFGISKILNSYYKYSTDILALFFYISYIIYNWTKVKNNHIYIKRLIVSLMVALIVPLILCPTFRYFLLVPLPKEGLIIQMMHNIYYFLK